MFKKIVWATDGSDAADEALPYVKELASEHRATVVVCHSILTMVAAGAHGAPLAVIDEDEIKTKLGGQVDELGAAGIDAELKLVGGDTLRGAAHDIVRVADADGGDLIVAATRGHTALGGLLLGSVTQRLLHLAKCPVLIIPSKLGAREARSEDMSREAPVRSSRA
jgi:nucleotide-binding universal stress UspA family protein